MLALHRTLCGHGLVCGLVCGPSRSRLRGLVCGPSLLPGLRGLVWSAWLLCWSRVCACLAQDPDMCLVCGPGRVCMRWLLRVRPGLPRLGLQVSDAIVDACFQCETRTGNPLDPMGLDHLVMSFNGQGPCCASRVGAHLVRIRLFDCLARSVNHTNSCMESHH